MGQKKMNLSGGSFINSARVIKKCFGVAYDHSEVVHPILGYHSSDSQPAVLGIATNPMCVKMFN